MSFKIALLFVFPEAGDGAVGHAAGGAAVFGLLQAYHADHSATTESRHGDRSLAPTTDVRVSRGPSHVLAFPSVSLTRTNQRAALTGSQKQ